MKQGACYIYYRNSKELRSIEKNQMLQYFFENVNINALPRDLIAEIQSLQMKNIPPRPKMIQKFSTMSYEDIVYKLPAFKKVKPDLYGMVLPGNAVIIITFLDLDALNKALGISNEKRDIIVEYNDECCDLAYFADNKGKTLTQKMEEAYKFTEAEANTFIEEQSKKDIEPAVYIKRKI